MKLLLVRHGHPNYEKDCLTELGHLQAKAAAERLKEEKIDVFFASTCGRAVETAQYAAAYYQKEITQLPFMREVTWGYDGVIQDPAAHPWDLVDRMILEGENLMDPDWKSHPPFLGNLVSENADIVAAGLDKWLEGLGYTREGYYYRCAEDTDKMVALFSHGGSSNAVLAHLLNLPFPYLLNVIRPDFTSVTVVRFPDTPGKLVMPVLELLNDTAHIANMQGDKFYGN